MQPGDQHYILGTDLNSDNERPALYRYTATEVASLQAKLDQQLGPEFISSRPGQGGQVHYIMAEKCINLANEVFGFNGWSSSIRHMEVDFVDQAKDGRWSIGVSVTVRVTLKDGTYHEDVGYGQMENGRTKAQCFEKAKKEGTTDGLKRALRNFGNLVGNCLYDKEYLRRITRIKPPAPVFDEKKLYRHKGYRCGTPSGTVPTKANTENGSNQRPIVESMPDDGIDEYGGEEFDELGLLSGDNDPFDGLIPDEFAIEAISDDKFTKAPTNLANVKDNILRNDGKISERASFFKGPHYASATVRTSTNLPQVTSGAAALGPHQQPTRPHLATGTHHECGITDRSARSNSPTRSLMASVNGTDGVSLPNLHHNPPPGFLTGRSVLKTDAQNQKVAPDTSPFDPHRPTTIPRSSGIDHTKSSPITKNQIPHSLQRFTPFVNFENPGINANRQIGVPPIGRPSLFPSTPTGLKRPADVFTEGEQGDRAVLGTTSTTQLNVRTIVKDTKKPRT